MPLLRSSTSMAHERKRERKIACYSRKKDSIYEYEQTVAQGNAHRRGAQSEKLKRSTSRTLLPALANAVSSCCSNDFAKHLTLSSIQASTTNMLEAFCSDTIYCIYRVAGYETMKRYSGRLSNQLHVARIRWCNSISL